MPLRTLRIVVAIMGLLILIAVALITATIMHRVIRPEAASAAHPFAAPPLELPKGAHVEALSTGTDRLVLEIALANGSRQLVILDLATGRRLGTIPLQAAP